MYVDEIKERWKVKIEYTQDDRTCVQVDYLEELSELASLIENGPNFQDLDQIVITYNLKDDTTCQSESKE